MANLEVNHSSPNELVKVVVKLNGTVVTTGYTLCIKAIGDTPPVVADPAWVAPSTAGTDSGIFVGVTAGRSFAAETYARVYALITDTPEQLILAIEPVVHFY